jgi:hypothetical protein
MSLNRVPLILALILLTGQNHSWAQSSCHQVLSSKIKAHLNYQNEYLEFSKLSKSRWNTEFIDELAYVHKDTSRREEKLEILKLLNFIFTKNGLQVPSHAEFIQSFLEVLKAKEISIKDTILPAVVLVRGEEFLLVTPGVDAWPTEPGYRILKSDELFNIPFRAVLTALKNRRFPLLDASHDVFHFVSFLMNPHYADQMASVLQRASADRYPKSFGRRMFFILELLSLGNPSKKLEMRAQLLFPQSRGGKVGLKFAEYQQLFDQLPSQKLLEHAEFMIKNFESYLIDYGGAVARSYEKAGLISTGYRFTGLNYDRVMVLSHYLTERRGDLESIGEDQIGGLSAFLLSELVTILKMPPDQVKAIAQMNSGPTAFLMTKNGKKLRSNYKEKLESLIRLQLARMEYLAWESAQESNLGVWLNDGLSVTVPAGSPLTEFVQGAFGTESGIYKMFLN